MSCDGLNISFHFVSQRLYILYNNLLQTINISSMMTSSISEYLFFNSVRFLSFNGITLSQQGTLKPLCIIAPLMLIRASPASASTGFLD